MRQAIALNAIRGINPSNSAHIEIVETLRALKFSTDEAVELRRAVVTEWLAAEVGHKRELLDLAKGVINQYARNYHLR